MARFVESLRGFVEAAPLPLSVFACLWTWHRHWVGQYLCHIPDHVTCAPTASTALSKQLRVRSGEGVKLRQVDIPAPRTRNGV